MSAYNDGLNQAVEGAFCDITRQGVAQGLLFAGLTAETLAGALAGIAASAISAHLYATYCGRPPLPPPYGTPQDWDGGQCVGVIYRVATVEALAIKSYGNFYGVGDLGQVSYVTGPISSIDILVNEGNFNEIRIRIVAASGIIDYVAQPGQTDDGINPHFYVSNLRKTVTRQDGAADVCGNPPLSPPPDNFTGPGNITYINRDGDTINTPVTFNFHGGRFGLNGDFYIPVDITNTLSPTLSISGTININSGNVTVNPGDPQNPTGNGDGPGDVYTPPVTPTPPPGTPPPAPGDPPLPPISTPPPPQNDDTPTPPAPKPKDPTKKPDKIIRGVIITTTNQQTDATIIYQENIPTIYAPALGYVSFLCAVDGAVGWSADIPVKNGRQIIECPWKYGAIDVKAQPKQGAIFDVRIVYDIKSL